MPQGVTDEWTESLGLAKELELGYHFAGGVLGGLLMLGVAVKGAQRRWFPFRPDPAKARERAPLLTDDTRDTRKLAGVDPATFNPTYARPPNTGGEG